jgi:XTP/dITP diphosphohydrolase
MNKYCILLATNNQHKISEISQILIGLPVDLRTLAEYPELSDIPETGNTFEENALIKARACFDHTGLLSLADDSGLEVDALNGEPGVHSARYSGVPHDYAGNNRKLLDEMKDISAEQRTARFRCVIALVGKNREEEYFEHCFHGICEGMIIDQLRGTQGFGYDPLFFIPSLQKTMAELDPAVKNQISHRADALKKFKSYIESWTSITKV